MTQLNPGDLAKAAYDAYGNSTGGLNFRGEPMPLWDDLGLRIQLAWTAAAGVVYTLATAPQEAPDAPHARDVPDPVVPVVPKKGWGGLRE